MKNIIRGTIQAQWDKSLRKEFEVPETEFFSKLDYTCRQYLGKKFKRESIRQPQKLPTKVWNPEGRAITLHYIN